jgi:outer membrane protein OmpA-like peptidoglycan-associated protein
VNKALVSVLSLTAFCVLSNAATFHTFAQAAQAKPGDENLAGLAAGAIVVQRAKATDSNGEAWYMLDEDVKTGWTSEPGAHLQPTVIELSDRSVIRSVRFDTANIETDGREPKEMLVEMSDTSATDGFKPIARGVLSAAPKDGQTFKATAEVPGRWLRVAVKSMQEPTHDIVQIMEFRAFGERVTHNPSPATLTGTYEGEDKTKFHLKQTGLTVTGCYDNGTKPLEGGLEGRLLRFTWNTETESGPAIAVFGANGDVFIGHWQTNSAVTEHPVMNTLQAKKISDTAGSCPAWKAPQDAIGSELKQTGRVRLYGINFDSDSDVIRSESKPTLDQVVAALKASADLKITIEGHTDSTSTAQHNQQLSQKRADAVKQYLVTGGIDAARLEATGFGATKPIAINDTPLGRAANRRVELVKR